MAYWAWPLVTLYFVLTSIQRLIHFQVSLPSISTTALYVMFTIFLLVSFPGTIPVTSDGIVQSFWLRRNKRIPWKNIVEINTGEKSRTVAITSSDGTEIVHSDLLVDRPRMLLELKQHCGENLPPDFPREPLAQS